MTTARLTLTATIWLASTLPAQQPRGAAAPTVAPHAGHQPERAARRDGKYSMLLGQYHAPDHPSRFEDKGLWDRPVVPGQATLPQGAYWVYAYPYWFAFRDCSAFTYPARNWGPEHATGAPDTPGYGDKSTAWAAKLENNPNGEWLLAEYAAGVRATAVEIHENFNAGAVSRVCILLDDGSELEAWKADTVEAVPGRRELNVPLPLGFELTRIKIYIDSGAVHGWNEIDAIALIDDKGARHWATSVASSNTFAPPRAAVPQGAPEVQVGHGRILIDVFPQPAPAPPPAAASAGAAAAEPEPTAQQVEAQIAELEAKIAEHQARLKQLEKQLEAIKQRQG